MSLLVPVTRVDMSRWLRAGLYEVVASVVEVRGLEALRYGSTVIYALPRRADGSCMFLDEGSCTIYEHRPLVCDIFPFAYDQPTDSIGVHPWALTRCEAILMGLRELTPEERERLLAEARIVSRELRQVDRVRGDYEWMIGEARRRLREAGRPQPRLCRGSCQPSSASSCTSS